MCNLYSHTKGPQAIGEFVRDIGRFLVGNLPPQPGIYPDYSAPIVRTGADGVRELVFARWGLPSPRKVVEEAAEKRAAKLRAKGAEVDIADMIRREPDLGVTNVRNAKSPHWRRWLGPESRCLVPFTSFSEPEPLPNGSRPPAWFALSDDRPLAFFAGIHVPGWTSTRKAKEGEVTADLYAFLTCQPNAEVGALHPKAMPVILTTPEECATWLAAPAPIALELQRPLPDGSLRIVARGAKEDA
jgi:putative SOS response-associated peptidase YedK